MSRALPSYTRECATTGTGYVVTWVHSYKQNNRSMSQSLSDVLAGLASLSSILGTGVVHGVRHVELYRGKVF